MIQLFFSIKASPAYAQGVIQALRWIRRSELAESPRPPGFLLTEASSPEEIVFIRDFPSFAALEKHVRSRQFQYLMAIAEVAEKRPVLEFRLFPEACDLRSADHDRSASAFGHVSEAPTDKQQLFLSLPVPVEEIPDTIQELERSRSRILRGIPTATGRIYLDLDSPGHLVYLQEWNAPPLWGKGVFAHWFADVLARAERAAGMPSLECRHLWGERGLDLAEELRKEPWRSGESDEEDFPMRRVGE